MPEQKNDQVFQLSLTEIAFTISFVLLLLLGYLIFLETEKRQALEREIGRQHSAAKAEAAAAAARERLAAAIQAVGGVANLDETVTRLVAAEQARAETERMHKQIQELDAALTALTEFRQAVAAAGPTGEAAVQQRVVSALALQKAVRDELFGAQGEKATSTNDVPRRASVEKVAPVVLPGPEGDRQLLARVKSSFTTDRALRAELKTRMQTDVSPGKEAETIHQVVDWASRYSEMAANAGSTETVKKENTDLRGQVAFLKNRLDARGGRDFPPCWADESGKVEFLFNIDLKDDGASITPAWPIKRELDARALPGLDRALASSHAYESFRSTVQPIAAWSHQHDPECRHYVQLRSVIRDAVQSDRARLMVEESFYKVEARR